MSTLFYFLQAIIVIGVVLSRPNRRYKATGNQGCDICADIVFLFDDSSSIPVADPHGYAKMKQFMVQVIKSFSSFGPPSGVQVSVVLVAHTIRNHFYLNNFTNIDDIVHSIMTFPELKGSATAIGEGLKFIKDHSFTPKHGGGRPCASKFLILMTDGKHNLGTMPRPQASALKADGVTIFSIGVGPNVLVPELYAIASKPEYVFNVTDFTQLLTINDKIADDTCHVAEQEQKSQKEKTCDHPGKHVPYGFMLIPILYQPPFLPSSPSTKPYTGTRQDLNKKDGSGHEVIPYDQLQTWIDEGLFQRMFP